MNPVPAFVQEAVRNVGILVNNHSVVESVRAALGSGQHAYAMVPVVLEEVLDEGAWMDRQDRNGNRYTFGSGEFARFIEEPTPKGLGTTKDEIRKYLGDSSNPLRVKFEELAEAKQGNHSWSHQPKGEGGKYVRIPNDIRDTVDTIPFPSNAPVADLAQPIRDRSKEPQAGTSVGYAVRRLQREATKDPRGLAAVAYERLKAGEVSAHAAMVQAGFVAKSITIPAVPEQAGRRLTLHFTREQFADLVKSAESEYSRKDDVQKTSGLEEP